MEISSLDVGDPPGVWADMGFAIDGATTWVAGVAHRLDGAGRGVTAWTLRGDGAVGLTELPVASDGAVTVDPGARHPNGVVGLDHVVVTTPDLARTTAAFESAGVRLRRTRDAGTSGRPSVQAFFRLGPTVIEVVGSPGTSGPGPACVWGLAYTVADLDATAACLGDRLGPITEAVQPGRRIATLRRSAGSTVPVAFLSGDGR